MVSNLQTSFRTPLISPQGPAQAYILLHRREAYRLQRARARALQAIQNPHLDGLAPGRGILRAMKKFHDDDDDDARHPGHATLNHDFPARHCSTSLLLASRTSFPSSSAYPNAPKQFQLQLQLPPGSV